VLQDTLRRLDKSYKAFSGRVKRGPTPGFPRLKGRRRYDSFTYPQSGFELSGKLQLSKIGNIKIKQHREIVGNIKTLTIRREAGCWWSSFLNRLAYKAGNAGRQVITVDPNYTSQECPNSPHRKEVAVGASASL
jgi:putative transposase